MLINFIDSVHEGNLEMLQLMIKAFEDKLLEIRQPDQLQEVQQTFKAINLNALYHNYLFLKGLKTSNYTPKECRYITTFFTNYLKYFC